MTPPIYRVGDQPPYLRWLLFGPSNGGKTTLACSASGKTLLANIEQGTGALTVDTGNKALNSRLRDVDVMDVRSFEDIWEVYDYMHHGGGCAKYTNLVLDSLTDLAGKCLEESVSEAELKTLRERMKDNPELGDYGRVNMKMGKVIRRFRDLPINLTAICLDRVPGDSSTDKRIGPALSPAIATMAVGYLDMTGYLDVDEDEEPEDGGPPTTVRKLLFYSPSRSIRVRDRLGVFTMNTGRRGLKNPTMDALMQEMGFGNVPKIEENGADANPPKPARPAKRATAKDS